MFLTAAQIRELTGKVKPSAQAKCLRGMGIEFAIRADGTLVVMTRAVEQRLGVGVTKTAKEQEPDFGALHVA